MRRHLVIDVVERVARIFSLEPLQFALSVADVDVKWTARHVRPRPFDMDVVVADLRRVIATDDCTVPLRISLHVDAERS